jgi:hypothetical protein
MPDPSILQIGEDQKRFFAELRGRRGAVKGSGISPSDRAEYSPKTEVLIAIRGNA